MRKFKIHSCSVALAVLAATMLSPMAVASGKKLTTESLCSSDNGQEHSGIHNSVLEIIDPDSLPTTRSETVARNKSLMVELPVKLRDIVVSNPEIVDAVVQTSQGESLLESKHEDHYCADAACNSTQGKYQVETGPPGQRVHIIGKKVGQANVFFFNEGGGRILTLEVQVEVDTRPLDAMLHRFIPGSHICTESLNDTLILTGSVRNPADSSRAETLASRFANTLNPQSGQTVPTKVINMLAVEGEEQVMLRVKFAEVQRSVLKQFGANVGARFENNNGIFQITTDNLMPVTNAEGLTDIGRIVGPPLGVVGVGSGVGGVFSAADATRQLAYTLRMLERNGLMRTLAEPNLTAVSGESANFLAGGEFPIPVASDEDTVTVEFKEYGVGLAFTPVVLSEGRISLKISTEVSELSTNGAVTFSNISIPALTKRKTESTVELPSGGTLAMSGLVQNNMQKNVDGYPGLKELPILGALFRSTDYVNEETELVVIVTPYIVRPTAKSELAAPTDDLVPATDKNTYLLGHLNSIHGGSVSLPAGSAKDSYGFIVE